MEKIERRLLKAMPRESTVDRLEQLTLVASVVMRVRTKQLRAKTRRNNAPMKRLELHHDLLQKTRR